MKVDAAIVAGGLGSRMGGLRKSLIEIDGRRIVDRQIAVLGPLVDQIWIVDRQGGGHPEVAGARLIEDRTAAVGPLGGIAAAFAASSADSLLVFGCDWPHLEPRVVELLRDARPDAAIVVPSVGGRPQPLHARYSRGVQTHVARLITEGRHRLLGLLEEPGLVVHYIEEAELRALDPTLRCMTNLNTPADLG